MYVQSTLYNVQYTVYMEQYLSSLTGHAEFKVIVIKRETLLVCTLLVCTLLRFTFIADFTVIHFIKNLILYMTGVTVEEVESQVTISLLISSFENLYFTE